MRNKAWVLGFIAAVILGARSAVARGSSTGTRRRPPISRGPRNAYRAGVGDEKIATATKPHYTGRQRRAKAALRAVREGGVVANGDGAGAVAELYAATRR